MSQACQQHRSSHILGLTQRSKGAELRQGQMLGCQKRKEPQVDGSMGWGWGEAGIGGRKKREGQDYFMGRGAEEGKQSGVRARSHCPHPQVPRKAWGPWPWKRQLQGGHSCHHRAPAQNPAPT